MAYDLIRGRQDGRDWSLGNTTIPAGNTPLAKYNAAQLEDRAPLTHGEVKGAGKALAIGAGVGLLTSILWAFGKAAHGHARRNRPKLYDSHGRLLK